MAQEQQEPEDFCPEADGHLDCLVTRLAGPDAPAPNAEQQSLFPENGLTFTQVYLRLPPRPAAPIPRLPLCPPPARARARPFE